MKKYDEKTVVKSNILIDSRHSFSLSEIKILATMISKISPDDKDFKPYRIYIKEYIQLDGSKRTDMYSEAIKISERLRDRGLTIKKDNGGTLVTGFISSADHNPNTGYVEFSFDPKLKPYLLELKNRFTQYRLQNIMHCKSMYSIRLYEILKSFEGLGERVISLDDFRFMLNIEREYKRFVDLKKRILDPAQKELWQYTDIHFSYERIKEGRSIVAIKFYITKNRQIRLQFGKPDEKTIEIETENKRLAKIKRALGSQGIDAARSAFQQSINNPFILKKIRDNGFAGKAVQMRFDAYLLDTEQHPAGTP